MNKQLIEQAGNQKLKYAICCNSQSEWEAVSNRLGIHFDFAIPFKHTFIMSDTLNWAMKPLAGYLLITAEDYLELPPTEIQEVETEKEEKKKYLETEHGIYVHREYVEGEFIEGFMKKLFTDGRIKMAEGQEEYFSTLHGKPIDTFKPFFPTPLPDALQKVRGEKWFKLNKEFNDVADNLTTEEWQEWHQRCNERLSKNRVQEVREKEEGGWIRFEDKKPEPGQPIWITWPSANYFPEYRELTETDLKQNWDMMFWLPVPPVPTPQAASNNTEK
jgi:hypothetical protein